MVMHGFCSCSSMEEPLGDPPDDEAHEGQEAAQAQDETVVGLGRPVLGCRNWEAYPTMRLGPHNRTLHVGRQADKQWLWLKRQQPELMLDYDATMEILRDDQKPERWLERRVEGLRHQGNALWLPQVPVVQDGSLFKHLMVHPAGPDLNRLQLSWLNLWRPEDEGVGDVNDDESMMSSDERAERVEGDKKGCWMSGSVSYSPEIGNVRQIAPLPAGAPDGDWDAEYGPHMAFARGVSSALLFSVASGCRRDSAAVDAGDDVPYHFRPLQRLTFPRPLLDVCAWSTQRAAFLTENLDLYEWTSATGAVSCGLSFKQALDEKEPKPIPNYYKGAQPKVNHPRPALPVGRLLCGSHPRQLWVAAGQHLHRVDLRQKPPAERVTLSVPIPAEFALPGLAPGLKSEEWHQIGAVAKHPTDENLLIVSAGARLLFLDQRSSREPVAYLRQPEPSSQLVVHIDAHTHRTLIVSASNTMGRLHLHHETSASDGEPSGVSFIDSWCSCTDWLSWPAAGSITSSSGAMYTPYRPLSYKTSTFRVWDVTVDRAEPVWLAGLGLASGRGYGLLPYMTSLGDVYVQKVGMGEDKGEVREKWNSAALPCGVSEHVMPTKREARDEVIGPPSDRLPQPWDEASMRTYDLVHVDLKALPMRKSLRRPVSVVGDGVDHTLYPKHQRRDRLVAAMGKVDEELRAFLAAKARTLFDIGVYIEELLPGTGVGTCAAPYRDLFAILRKDRSLFTARLRMPSVRAAKASDAVFVDTERPVSNRKRDAHVEGVASGVGSMVAEEDVETTAAGDKKAGGAEREGEEGVWTQVEGSQGEERQRMYDDEREPKKERAEDQEVMCDCAHYPERNGPCYSTSCVAAHTLLYWSSPSVVEFTNNKSTLVRQKTAAPPTPGITMEDVQWLRGAWKTGWQSAEGDEGVKANDRMHT